MKRRIFPTFFLSQPITIVCMIKRKKCKCGSCATPHNQSPIPAPGSTSMDPQHQCGLILRSMGLHTGTEVYISRSQYSTEQSIRLHRITTIRNSIQLPHHNIWDSTVISCSKKGEICPRDHPYKEACCLKRLPPNNSQS